VYGKKEKKRRRGKKRGKKHVHLLTYIQFEDITREPHAYGNQIILHIFIGGKGKEKKPKTEEEQGKKTCVFTHLQSTRGHCAWATCVWESDRPGKC